MFSAENIASYLSLIARRYFIVNIKLHIRLKTNETKTNKKVFYSLAN